MRYKVSIEFVQVCDAGDFSLSDRRKKAQCRDEIAKHIESEILEGDLRESFCFAEEQGTLKVKVKYLDEKY